MKQVQNQMLPDNAFIVIIYLGCIDQKRVIVGVFVAEFWIVGRKVFV
jgi:hypothetical protein